MKTGWKVGLGAAFVASAVVIMAGTASAADHEAGNAGTGLEGTGVRHGIRYEACSHFELVDQDAIEAWAIDNAIRFSKWALKIDEVRADPEPALVDFLSFLFPECRWPPPPTTTFGPARIGWDESMVLAKAAVKNLDLASADGGARRGQRAAAALGTALAFAMRGRGFPGGAPG